MPPSTLTPDEWLVLQSVPLWMLITNNNNKSYYNANFTTVILSISLEILEYAEKTAKEKIVFELLFAMPTNHSNAAKKFQADSRLPEIVFQDFFSILNTKLPVQEADAIREIYEWYL